MHYITHHITILALALGLASCTKAVVVQPPVKTFEQQVREKEGVDNLADFFAMDEGSVRLSYEELVGQWNKSKLLYLGGRPGLTDAEIQQIAGFKLGFLFIVHGHKPDGWRHITAMDGHETDIGVINWPNWPNMIQANYSHVPLFWIDYGNPYALPCEYFHLFEQMVRGNTLREPELQETQGTQQFVYEIVGHCTPDDPMGFCCWDTTAYDVPAGR